MKSARIGSRRLENGELLHRAEDHAVDAYTLFDGFAITYLILPNGARQIIRFVLPGDLLFVMPGRERTAPSWPYTTEAVGEAVFCVLSGATLRALFEKHIRVPQSLAAIAQLEERMLAEHLTDLGRRPALHRVARLMLELLWRLRLRDKATETRCYLPFTQEQIGDAVGLTNVHVSRVLASLRDAGIMTIENKVLTVADPLHASARFDFDPEALQPRPLI